MQTRRFQIRGNRARRSLLQRAIVREALLREDGDTRQRCSIRRPCESGESKQKCAGLQKLCNIFFHKCTNIIGVPTKTSPRRPRQVTGAFRYASPIIVHFPPSVNRSASPVESPALPFCLQQC